MKAIKRDGVPCFCLFIKDSQVCYTLKPPFQILYSCVAFKLSLIAKDVFSWIKCYNTIHYIPYTNTLYSTAAMHHHQCIVSQNLHFPQYCVSLGHCTESEPRRNVNVVITTLIKCAIMGGYRKCWQMVAQVVECLKMCILSRNSS